MKSNVLVYQSNVDPEAYTALSWPDQAQAATASTRGQAENLYLEEYNVTRDEVRFFGPLLVTANLVQINNEWKAYATADRIYSITNSTEDGAKEAFINLWNDEYMPEYGAEKVDITDQNVDWVYE